MSAIAMKAVNDLVQLLGKDGNSDVLLTEFVEKLSVADFYVLFQKVWERQQQLGSVRAASGNARDEGLVPKNRFVSPQSELDFGKFARG